MTEKVGACEREKDGYCTNWCNGVVFQGWISGQYTQGNANWHRAQIANVQYGDAQRAILLRGHIGDIGEGRRENGHIRAGQGTGYSRRIDHIFQWPMGCKWHTTHHKWMSNRIFGSQPLDTTHSDAHWPTSWTSRSVCRTGPAAAAICVRVDPTRSQGTRLILWAPHDPICDTIGRNVRRLSEWM